MGRRDRRPLEIAFGIIGGMGVLIGLVAAVALGTRCSRAAGGE